jgi:hypothetical protein
MSEQERIHWPLTLPESFVLFVVIVASVSVGGRFGFFYGLAVSGVSGLLAWIFKHKRQQKMRKK